MSTPDEVTSNPIFKIASLLETNNATFTVGGSIPIVIPDDDKSTDINMDSAQHTSRSSPITIRWDPPEAPTGESRNISFPPSQGVEQGAEQLLQQQQQLDALLRDCQPATFGRGNRDILDETYRKASKMDSSKFSSDLCPYELGIVDSVAELLMPSSYMAGGSRGVVAELYKLNIYSGPSGHFKPHVDTPRSEQQFGSLVICLPCPHQGGALAVRHAGQTVTYDWGSDDTNEAPTLQWAAFYSDCEHEVFEVTSGHRVTLTYNLYSVPRRVEYAGKMEGVSLTGLPLYKAVQEAVENPLFMPKGGLLGFYCCHAYPHSARSAPGSPLFPSILKGIDLQVYSTFHALGLDVQVRTALPDSRTSSDPWWDNDEYDEQQSESEEFPEDAPTFLSHRSDTEGTNITDACTDEGFGWDEVLSAFGTEVRVRWLNYCPGGRGGGLSQPGFVHGTYGNEAGVDALYTYAVIIARVKEGKEREREETGRARGRARGRGRGKGRGKGQGSGRA
ncbi:hypothetical protein FQN53_004167 [Emmonsiellopsis sp. PD_33]|nr:hypothetical protein FQN53_004167 [Emmonsiellopsis sp. PD_33]